MKYNSVCDDWYCNLNLSTEMDLPQSRETVLHFFEQIQRQYPTMRNFYSRERGEFVLEEEKDRGAYRWATVEPRRVCSGQVNPPAVAEALKQHRLILELAPYALTLSPLDCESISVQLGFDFNYRGNHNQLLVETLGVPPAYERLLEITGATSISYEPALQLALDSECRSQMRISVESRTSAYHVRTGEFPAEQISVYLTARRYGGLDPGETYVSVLNRLADQAREIVDNFVVDQVLRPLQQAIAIR